VPASAWIVVLNFDLQSIDAPIVISGVYDMTLTAANECTQLPSVARQRTVRAKLDPRYVTSEDWMPVRFPLERT